MADANTSRPRSTPSGKEKSAASEPAGTATSWILADAKNVDPPRRRPYLLLGVLGLVVVWVVFLAVSVASLSR